MPLLHSNHGGQRVRARGSSPDAGGCGGRKSAAGLRSREPFTEYSKTYHRSFWPRLKAIKHRFGKRAPLGKTFPKGAFG